MISTQKSFPMTRTQGNIWMSSKETQYDQYIELCWRSMTINVKPSTPIGKLRETEAFIRGFLRSSSQQ